ncbi:hypothetical protein BJF93_16350 [Xaviernesmea oryzae]|uniref:Uncharacterized protein n=1 Tax=Xaviernesmea oryzae TaxID=464029 RepID=A0A1Q9ASS9_9HYPH|nr:DUF6105 family protein [Xaviernesmea oryzae]OLP58448.1 hypothetical protein BJF93_16350 [Xaviernesmea oryzae]SEM22138.1 hypothetical protein SAMN04487976_12334 [Xaviernesmea oryzae]
MKWVLIAWGGPLLFLSCWYGLSFYDLNFGLYFFSRDMHDLVMQIYGSALGLPPEAIPPLVARALAFDTLLVFGLLALRRRKTITGWIRRRLARAQQVVEVQSEPSVDAARASAVSLSSAP